MRIMDRHLFWQFVFAYLVCFGTMVGLYVIIDLFANADEFIEDHPGAWVALRRAATYYFFHSFEYFNRLSPIITMVAAMFTLANLHRSNEIVALLAAGIPTRRALYPILLGVLLVVTLGVLNREFLLPRYSEILQRMHEDIEANTTIAPTPHIDGDHVLISAKVAVREYLRIDQTQITVPIEIAGQLTNIHATHAYYETHPETGEPGWRIVGSGTIDMRPNEKLVPLGSEEYFLYSDVTFSDMIRHKTWVHYASTAEMIEALNHDSTKNAQLLRTAVHNRLMQPILNLVLVLLGIPFVLQWERKNVYQSIAVAMLLCGLFFVVDSSASYFANYEYIDAPLAAWIPVILFGPLSLALLDRIGT